MRVLEGYDEDRVRALSFVYSRCLGVVVGIVRRGRSKESGF